MELRTMERAMRAHLRECNWQERDPRKATRGRGNGAARDRGGAGVRGKRRADLEGGAEGAGPGVRRSGRSTGKRHREESESDGSDDSA